MDKTVEKSDAIRKATSVLPENLLRFLARLIRRGNASRMIISDGTEVMVDVPVTAGLIGAALWPWFAFFAGMVLLASRLSLEIRRPPET
ncbi:MAG: DUF4342 domain-containing protein [Bacillota bacterium]|jgi:hypothetical protein